MLFNSVTFAVFLPVVFLLYYIVPHKYRWAFLLLASYAFYMNLHFGYGLLLLFTTVLTYALARGLEAAPSAVYAKPFIRSNYLFVIITLFKQLHRVDFDFILCFECLIIVEIIARIKSFTSDN